MCTWEKVSLESSYSLEVIWSFGSHLVILQNYSVLSFFLSSFSIYLFIYLFTYFWLPWVFVAVCGLSLVVESGGYSLVLAHGLHIVVASFVVEHGLLGIWSSVVAACSLSSCISRAPKGRLRSCGTGLSCPKACGIFLDQ